MQTHRRALAPLGALGAPEGRYILRTAVVQVTRGIRRGLLCGCLFGLFALHAIFLAACSSHPTGSGPAADAGPLPECEAYQRALARCSGRPNDIVTPLVAHASTDAERASVRALCAENLERLNKTCR